MGNAQSDREEDKAWKVVRWVPLVNLGYGVVRTSVYLGKQDPKRAVLTLVDSTACVVTTMVGQPLAAGVACATIEAATIPIQGKAIWDIITTCEQLPKDNSEDPDGNDSTFV